MVSGSTLEGERELDPKSLRGAIMLEPFTIKQLAEEMQKSGGDLQIGADRLVEMGILDKIGEYDGEMMYEFTPFGEAYAKVVMGVKK